MAHRMFPSVNGEPGRFIIGNHADEMQPWVPVIAALTNADYLSIPCCAWEFDTRFQLKKNIATSKEKETDPLDGQLVPGEVLPTATLNSCRIRTPEEEDLERKLRFDEVGGKLGLYACKCDSICILA